MSIASVANILGGGVVGEVMKGLDSLFTSDKEKLEAQQRLTEILQRPLLAQVEINKQEAAHASVFVAGWRPAIGWVCAASLAWAFIGYDCAVWGTQLFAPHISVPKLGGTDNLLELVLAMLGLAGMRTYEKKKGVA